jgi:prepilin-type N-terminal cleavage/methylation domain-containing protein
MNRPHAFTLLELLVALGVTSVLVVLMFNVFLSGSTLWQKNEEQLDTFREARAAMQMMTRDFSGLSAVPDAPDKFPILALRYHSDTAPEDEVNKEIYGIVPARNPGRGSLCAVGYFCVWDASKSAFVLRRQFTESNTTFDNLKAALSVGSPLSPAQAFDTLYARPTKNTAEQTIDDIATYVYSFDVEWAETNPPPQPSLPPQPTVQLPWPQTFAREVPAWVEIRFKALGSNAARKLAGQGINRTTWTSPTNSTYQRMILPGEQQFVTRIKLSR